MNADITKTLLSQTASSQPFFLNLPSFHPSAHVCKTTQALLLLILSQPFLFHFSPLRFREIIYFKRKIREETTVSSPVGSHLNSLSLFNEYSSNEICHCLVLVLM